MSSGTAKRTVPEDTTDPRCRVAGIGRITSEELRRRGVSQFLLIDVREEEIFKAGRIKGSINMPKSTQKWPTLRAGVRAEALKKKIIVIDEGNNGDGMEVADLLSKLIKRRGKVYILIGGMRGLVRSRLRHRFEGTLEFKNRGPPLKPVKGTLGFSQSETPLTEDNCKMIEKIASKSFNSILQDLRADLMFNRSKIDAGREVKRLRHCSLFDNPIRSPFGFRVFCAFELKNSCTTCTGDHAPDKRGIVRGQRSALSKPHATSTSTTTATSVSPVLAPRVAKRRREDPFFDVPPCEAYERLADPERNNLVGFLVLKHSTPGNSGLQKRRHDERPNRHDENWAIVKYVCGIRKGVGYQLQKQAWVFARDELKAPRVYAGAWLEFHSAWISHIRWGYRSKEVGSWPRSANSAYGQGIVGMCKELVDDQEEAEEDSSSQESCVDSDDERPRNEKIEYAYGSLPDPLEFYDDRPATSSESEDSESYGSSNSSSGKDLQRDTGSESESRSTPSSRRYKRARNPKERPRPVGRGKGRPRGGCEVELETESETESDRESEDESEYLSESESESEGSLDIPPRRRPGRKGRSKR